MTNDARRRAEDKLHTGGIPADQASQQTGSAVALVENAIPVIHLHSDYDFCVGGVWKLPRVDNVAVGDRILGDADP